MIRLLLLTLFFVLASSTNVIAVTEDVSVPNPEAFLGWRDVTSYVTSNVDWRTLSHVEIQCESSELTPTGPTQKTKLYHAFRTGRYDHHRLTGDSMACARGGKFVNGHGVLPCLVPDLIEDVVLSDLYQDRCGHTYRGFWRVTFLKQNESMGTLFSLGRTVYPDPKSQDPLDMVVGPTYVVDRTQFLFLSEVF